MALQLNLGFENSWLNRRCQFSRYTARDRGIVMFVLHRDPFYTSIGEIGQLLILAAILIQRIELSEH